MLLRMYCMRQYGALQHDDAMVCDSIAGCGIYRGRKSFVEGYVNVGIEKCDYDGVC